MEKRVVLAIVLSIAVLFAFRYYEERRAAELAKLRPPAPRSQPVAAPPPPVQPAEQPQARPPASIPPSENVPAQEIAVESDLYRAVLDSHGGVVRSWQLKNYRTARGRVFDMVSDAHMEERPFPAVLLFDDPALTKLANGEDYSVEVAGGRPEGKDLAAPATVVMRLARGDLVIEKRFRFDPSTYLVEFDATFRRGSQPLRGRFLLGQDIGPEHEHLLNRSNRLQAVADIAGKVQRFPGPKDENEVRQVAGPLQWVGLDMQYFAGIVIPAQPIPAFEIQRRPVKALEVGGGEVARDLIRLTIPADGAAAYRIYLGPKLPSQLQAVPGASLYGVIDYGWFSILVAPLLAGLRFINQYTSNYGVAIILLTLVLTLLLFPFRLKQMTSMKKMQVLQPRIKEIQERYKKYKRTDPKRAEMNQEMMALYKEHNVNPLGGCLPLLLQMPILFAFYRLLASSIELRQAPFLGWLQDLSAKDPYYVLPIIMGITMLVMQKMTPMTPGADPTQAKMMMMMPVIFTVMFLNVSSGLNLYFLCSNVFQIGFQKIAERWIGDQPSVRKSKK